MPETRRNFQLGRLLKLWRSVEDIGIREAARRIGIPIANLSRIERGMPCDVRSLVKLLSWLISPEGE